MTSFWLFLAPYAYLCHLALLPNYMYSSVMARPSANPSHACPRLLRPATPLNLRARTIIIGHRGSSNGSSHPHKDQASSPAGLRAIYVHFPARRRRSAIQADSCTACWQSRNARQRYGWEEALCQLKYILWPSLLNFMHVSWFSV
ncbi:hypothetical protein K458DRAFT_81945 [Lentithecium fluviatile CBS 122367]|uniref:Uncharacterized protein n=1 Tax=Lentithecium fluviatile CBS 122367 TaxID=1168545 RepID=A0A6G1IUB1_9PLEO|nr:hypothetical protein K458DRAFT_81945 [Lentithecium fluviatile CBS 122367]